MPSSLVVPLHLGTLHPYEQALVALIAVGPFVVLFIVVLVLRRRDAAQDPHPRTSSELVAPRTETDDLPRDVIGTGRRGHRDG